MPASGDELLLVRIEANLAKFERAMARATGGADRAASRIETRFKKMDRNLALVGAGLARSLAGPLAALVSARALTDALNTYQRIENSLKVAGLQGEELTAVFEHLSQTAEKNGAPVEALVQLYSRLSLVQQSLGATSGEIIRFTEGVATALRVSGKSAQESSGALLQLSQAMGSGIVRAEEFNAILEGALPIAQAAARGLKEAGGSVAALRTLIINGKVSSEAFFRAFEAGQQTLEALAATTELTLGQSFENLRTRLIGAVGKLNDATDISGRLEGVMESLGSSIEFVADQLARIASSDAGDAMGGIVDKIGIGFDKLGRLTSGFFTGKFRIDKGGHEFVRHILDTDDAILEAEDKLKRDLEKRTPIKTPELIAGPSEKTKQALGESEKIKERVRRLFADVGESDKVDQVSLKDFKPPATTGTGRKKRTADDRFGDDLDRMRQRTQLLQLETSLVGQNADAREHLLAIQQLINEAEQAGVKITPDVLRSIEQQAAAYANATTALEAAENAQRDLVDRLDSIRDAAGSALSALDQSLMNGEGPAAALNAALKDVLQTIIRIGEQKAIASLFGAAGTASPGIFGSVIGALTGSPAAASAATPAALSARRFAAPAIPSFGRAGVAAAPVVRVHVVRGEMFEPVVQRISGAVTVQHVRASEQRMPSIVAAHLSERQRAY